MKDELSTLAADALTSRIDELRGSERQVLVQFLIHLGELDRRKLYLEVGFPSLWEYCRQRLHLSEGDTHRRIAGARAVRRFSEVATCLRDGRLSLCALSALAPVLDEGTCEDLLARATHLSKRQTEALVASLRPKERKRDSVRRVPRNALSPVKVNTPGMPEAPRSAPAEPKRDTVRPASAEHYRIALSVSREFVSVLEEAKLALSHKFPHGRLEDVLREGLRLVVEKHAKRRGTVPAKARKARVRAEAPKHDRAGRAPIAAAVRRDVWQRDGGRCVWRSPAGRTCGSRFQVELDHIVPASRGGDSSPGNLRLLCRHHNQYSAAMIFGEDFMARFRGGNGSRFSVSSSSAEERQAPLPDPPAPP